MRQCVRVFNWCYDYTHDVAVKLIWISVFSCLIPSCNKRLQLCISTLRLWNKCYEVKVNLTSLVEEWNLCRYYCFQNMYQHFVNYLINTLEHKLYILFCQSQLGFSSSAMVWSTIDETVSIGRDRWTEWNVSVVGMECWLNDVSSQSTRCKPSIARKPEAYPILFLVNFTKM